MGERERLAGLSDPLLCAVAWSRLAEPGDPAAGALRSVLGPVEALAWVLEASRGGGIGLSAPLADVADPSMWRRAVARWEPRVESLRPERELEVAARHGSTVLVPGQHEWPGRLDDLGALAPACLWVRGDPGAWGPEPAAGEPVRLLAMVGARAATGYGEHVAADLAAGLHGHGVRVVSGGAYGIDAAAHRGALAAGAPTIAVMAGGLDRLYPAGNNELLLAVERTGAVVSELPPGSAPSRSRFLQRNRLIAALSSATVVVEAAWRSGALSTATHAARLLRPVGAVPGPVTSAASAGCHRLLREGGAVCVTDAAEAAELALPLGQAPVPEAAQPRRGVAGVADPGQGAPFSLGRNSPPAADVARGRAPDGLEDAEVAVWDALPARGAASVDSVARVSGRDVRQVRACLGRLELSGHVQRLDGKWRRAKTL